MWTLASSQGTSSPSIQMLFNLSTMMGSSVVGSKRLTASPSARQEHEPRAGAAVVVGRRGKCRDVARRSALAQPGRDLASQHRVPPGRVGALAVDDDHHAIPVAGALLDERLDRLAGLVGAEAVEVELSVDGVLPAAKTAQGAGIEVEAAAFDVLAVVGGLEAETL